MRLVGLGAGMVATGFVIGSMEEPAQCSVAEMIGASTAEQVAALESRLQALEIVSATQTSSAFVFIKPHAVTDKTVQLVKDKFASAGIRVTSEGNLGYEQIDKELLIDTHYGAIANRAVKQKPNELIVQESAKKKFQEKFGENWDEVVAAGRVYNAMDACAKLGLNGEELDKVWCKDSKVKFGGGFYAGKCGDIYVMNGFYMSMRAAYTTPPAAIHYFTVEWPTSSLAWGDFREKVLGATDPATAASGSARRMILDQWEALGLKSMPNTGDNGVHASASPYEALAERANWLKQDISQDAYGRGLIAAGVSEATLKDWSGDPAVSYDGKLQSIFDLLEDLDADECLAKAVDIAK